MSERADDRGADADFLRRFDAERARVLRRRIAWYCAVLLGLLAISLWGSLMDGEDPDPGAPPAHAAGPPGAEPGTLAVDLMYDLPLVGLYAGALAYVLLARPDRRRLVLAVTALTALACGFAMAMEPIADFVARIREGRPLSANEEAWRPGLMGLMASSILMTIALVLVPMSLREAMRIGLICLVVYGGVLAVLLRPPPAAGLVMVGLLVGAGAPGVVWSVWRHREFDERFRAGELKERLGEMAGELAYARRIHEALFPPPVDRGAVRLRYVYQPMREIGGDFLFAHPLAFPPSSGPRVLTVVLLDVSGHGIPAALAVNRLHGELRRFFAADAGGGPDALLAALNAYCYADLAEQAMYASALCLRADAARGVLEWGSAGHPPALLIRGGGAVEELKATAVMLGVVPPEAFRAQARAAPFGAGDAALAFTDGALEVMDASGRPLGLDGLRAAIKDTPPERLVETAAAAVNAHRSGRVLDDTLVVSVTIGAGEPAAEAGGGAGTSGPRREGPSPRPGRGAQ